MGVAGLTLFVDRNPHLLTDYRLYNTRVVIDGNNLYHFLYSYFHINQDYGGDYNAFADHIKFYLKTLKMCDVEPYIIFDGGYEPSDRKWNTVLKRARDRISAAHSVIHGGRGRVLPLMAYDTFRSVIIEMKVNYMVCDLEADSQLAALANQWECPVMSNDSDFYIFDVKAGFILFDYLNLEMQTMEADGKAYNYLNVQIYYIDAFFDLIRHSDRTIITLFATVMGNDYVQRKTFVPFFQAVKLPKVASCKRFNNPKKNSKTISLIKWLESHERVSDAVGYILRCFKSEKRSLMRDLIEKSMDSYTKLHTTIHRYFQEGFVGEPEDQQRLVSYAGNALPKWYVAGLRRGCQSVFSLNALCLHKSILLSQVELMHEPSTYNCALPIRQVMYGILLSLDGELDVLATDPPNIPKRKSCVEEYSRDGPNQRHWPVLPTRTLPSGQTVPQMSEVNKLGEKERMHIMLDALTCSEKDLAEIPADLKLFVAVLVFWLRNANPQVTPAHLYALLVCVIKLNVVDTAVSVTENNIDLSCVGRSSWESDSDEEMDIVQNTQTAKAFGRHSSESDGSEGKVTVDQSDPQNNPSGDASAAALEFHDLHQDSEAEFNSYSSFESGKNVELIKLQSICSELHLAKAAEYLGRYCGRPRHKTFNERDSAIIHGFAQFQACFQMATYLNNLLQQPLAVPTPAQIYCGSFLYRLVRDMKFRVNPQLFASELLVRSSCLAGCFQHLTDVVLHLVGTTCFHTVITKANRRNKKKAGKKDKGKQSVVGSKQNKCASSDSENEPSNTGTIEQDLVASCDLSNRFRGLLLE